MLSIGNPLPNEQAGSLAGAEAEAKEIAAMYPSRALLIGASATKQPSSSAAISAAVSPPVVVRRLGENQVRRHRLAETRVCMFRNASMRLRLPAAVRHPASTTVRMWSTAKWAMSQYARLLMTRPQVRGAWWERCGKSTMRRRGRCRSLFHRSLRDGATPAAALRTTQIGMIRRAASPRVWASLQLYGSGS